MYNTRIDNFGLAGAERILFRHRGCRGAFTLVELLVVIGIIALLISILLPSLNKARASAQAVSCQSNLRQVYLATLFYSETNRGFIPAALGPKIYGGIWYRAIPGEIPAAPIPRTSRRIYTCPSFDRTMFNYGETNYAINAYIHASIVASSGIVPAPPPYYEPIKLGQVKIAAEVPMYIDAKPAPDAPADGGDWYLIARAADWSGPPTGKIGFHHSRRANIVFFNGHTGNVEELQGPALNWSSVEGY